MKDTEEILAFLNNSTQLYASLLTSKNGSLIPVFASGKTMESRYNPQNDAARFIETISFSSFYIVLGIGSGIAIEALYKKDYFNRDGYYFGGIDTNAHVNKQLGYAYDWRMKSPSMYGISLGMNDMTVGDFRDGKSSPFTYSNFEHYLTMLLTARGFRNPSSYDFYWNSQRSNQQVWDSVSCNCCDGAELIVEIAKDMGLNNATTIHGHWVL